MGEAKKIKHIAEQGGLNGVVIITRGCVGLLFPRNPQRMVLNQI